MKKTKEISGIKGITLIALAITIIVLLILAGITIAQLSGNGLFDKTRVAKEKYKNAEEQEDEEIAKYSNEIDGYVDGDRDIEKTKYSETILFDGNETTKNITFLNNHKVTEFDTIMFIYGLVENNKYCTILESEYKVSTWNYALQNGNLDVPYLLELDGLGNRNIGISNLSETGCKIGAGNSYHLFRILGINY